MPPALIPTGDAEARALAAFMARTCRPIPEADQAELLYWLNRLDPPNTKETRP